jgi:hypothetical protein
VLWNALADHAWGVLLSRVHFKRNFSHLIVREAVKMAACDKEIAPFLSGSERLRLARDESESVMTRPVTHSKDELRGGSRDEMGGKART